jgi:hypothetical protein
LRSQEGKEGHMDTLAKGQLDKELCVITMLLKRLEEDSIPTVLDMRRKVDRGERLTDAEIEYLERILSDAETFGLSRLLEHHPDYSRLVGAFFSLCGQVIESDLRGEEKGRPPSISP